MRSASSGAPVVILETAGGGAVDIDLSEIIGRPRPTAGGGKHDAGGELAAAAVGIVQVVPHVGREDLILARRQDAGRGVGPGDRSHVVGERVGLHLLGRLWADAHVRGGGGDPAINRMWWGKGLACTCLADWAPKAWALSPTKIW